MATAVFLHNKKIVILVAFGHKYLHGKHVFSRVERIICWVVRSTSENPTGNQKDSQAHFLLWLPSNNHRSVFSRDSTFTHLQYRSVSVCRGDCISGCAERASQ